MVIRLLKILGIIAAVLAALFFLGNKADIPVAELEKEYLTPESRYVQLSDAKVHVRIRGNGPYLFLIHGSFASLHTWEHWEDTKHVLYNGFA